MADRRANWGERTVAADVGWQAYRRGLRAAEKTPSDRTSYGTVVVGTRPRQFGVGPRVVCIWCGRWIEEGGFDCLCACAEERTVLALRWNGDEPELFRPAGFRINWRDLKIWAEDWSLT